jgi:hypothetical protein
MAKKSSSKLTNTSSGEISTFLKGIGKDAKGMYTAEASWIGARNAVNNSVVGDLAELSNEASNRLCQLVPYTIIGAIHLDKAEWAIYSTDDSNSEIGVFDEDGCTYRTVVNDPCLSFNKDYLIIGQSRTNFDCTKQVYWADALNPDRTMNLDNPPWIQNCTDDNGADPGGCIECVDTDQLNCEKLRIAPLIDSLCFQIEVGPTSGELLNGSYYVVGAYVLNGQRVTEYSMPSNIQGLFTHENRSSSLEIVVDADDSIFEEFELVLVQRVAEATQARRVGFYSTRQKRIAIDSFITTWADISIQDILLRTPVVEKSDGIFKNGSYLIRTGPRERFDFNYQPLANQIESNWVAVEYPADYYRKGGTNTGYLRDEVYAFFIRWVYNTGDRSASYHIPGRVATPFDTALVFNQDSQVDINDGLTPFRWRVYNTASRDFAYPTSTLPDGGQIIAGGEMAYWESTEFYDDNQPEIWNATYVDENGVNIGNTTNTDFDLCGKPIRHHKFPENATDTVGDTTNHFTNNGSRIRIMSVQFNNILPPVDNNGVPIPGVVGYEILRGSREGNKSVFAKGMINNMREYKIPDNFSTRQGLYPNYPYNYLGSDKFLNESATVNCSLCPFNYYIQEHEPYTGYRQDVFTFHSPETNFRNPFLSNKEVKIYGEFWGNVEGNFQFPDKHPKFKLISNTAFILAALAGLSYGMRKSHTKDGNKRIKWIPGRGLNLGGVFLGPAGAGNQPIGLGTGSSAATIAEFGSAQGAEALWITNYLTGDFTALGGALGSFNPWEGFLNQVWGTSSASVLSPGSQSGYYEIDWIEPDWTALPGPLRFLNNAPLFVSDWSTGINDFIKLIQAWLPWRQYALQYVSHGFYNQYKRPSIGNIRRGIKEEVYLDPILQDFSNYRINNIFRSRTVVVETEDTFSDPTVTDTTQKTFSDVAGTNGIEWDNETDANVSKNFQTTASGHYVALKQRLGNQYGQLRGIIQVPVSTCPTDISQTKTEVLFNGDTYVGRYTEKNTMFFFYEWLYDLPNGTEFDYRFYKMLPHPKFWMDTEAFDFNEFINSIGNVITSGFDFTQISIPSRKFAFDRRNGGVPWRFGITDAFFYLFNSGVKDFFVESEINLDYRDWDALPYQRHYDREQYTDLREMFKPPYVKFGNYYKYDYSLSVSKLFNNYQPWGFLQEPTYDPKVAEKCYIYRPKRVIYSLPQDQENKKDYWRVYLAANYKDFSSKVTGIHPISKSGAILLFETESPIFFAGVDQLETDSNLKLTIGDGGLFSQPLQNLVNVDEPNEYGSCQNRLSIVNTPLGMFYMSQNQGKIFQVTSALSEISNLNMKWWFATYLPYQLLKDFPEFELVDNPVVGIGCQSVFDNTDQIVFFCKKDYALRKDIADQVDYVDGRVFLVNKVLRVELGDPRYFEDASWTFSYDPKNKIWVSYHDWHPDLTLASKNTFMTTNDNGIWVHNDRCDSFCNFYGTDYPFEIEIAATSKTTVNTLRNIEYYMEVYKYDQNCYDRFHDLDFNFDEAIVYNTEQCSGLLRLNLKPKNNAPGIIAYPIINFNNIDILYSKEEQKYRFNQFWDITDDRGEFSVAERVIFNTSPNGYVKTLNPTNLNYDKFELERKKFRHYITNVLLRRRVSGNRNMVVIVVVNNNLLSSR